MDALVIIVLIAVFVAFIFIMRWLGAWMLRIDEIIDLQKAILKELRSIDKAGKPAEVASEQKPNTPKKDESSGPPPFSGR